MSFDLSEIINKLRHPHEFISMGGYGAYIWSCYGLAFVMLLGVMRFYQLRLRRAKSQQELVLQSKLPKFTALASSHSEIIE
ncbi:MAG: heme exporter protein CcmD [Alphaproteobacteria bacterium]|nr:heme exporter protein CcmD [Alphaproteobacteria bacterium]